MKNSKLLLSAILLWKLSISAAGEISELQGTTSQWKLFRKNGPCERDQFRCLNDKCISSELHCNEVDDCGDNSDEDYCGRYVKRSCPTKYPFYRCSDGKKCIPQDWICNGGSQCPYGDDERTCEGINRVYRDAVLAKKSAIKWLLNQTKNESATDRWGPHASRIAVALYLANPSLVSPDTSTGRELAYELSLPLLSKFARKKHGDISTSELAHQLNALIVTCVNPRNFFAVDLVAELRSRVDKQKYTNPYVMLALCNAGDKITHEDVKKISLAFWEKRLEFWTDIQAFGVMALACAAAQPHSSINIREYAMALIRRQSANGTVENLKTTALATQAYFAAEMEDDENTFDEVKAISQIVLSQKQDGSFGSLVDTYYVLPVLSHRSLVNISSSHCKVPPKDKDSALDDLINQIGPKRRIQYSVRIGDEMAFEKTLKLKLPVNTTFYGVMEWAAKIDPNYRAKYNVKDGKPFVYSISGIQDDPENDKFWFPYVLRGKNLTLITMSPADHIPEENEHLIFWYKRGSWIK